jgi:hypothetical protein
MRCQTLNIQVWQSSECSAVKICKEEPVSENLAQAIKVLEEV